MPKYWNEPQETLSGDELKALQLRKLSDTISTVYEKSPYYREKLQSAGVHPGSIKHLEDYEAVPFFTKEEERKSQAESMAQFGHPLGMHLTCDISEVNRMSASSGTTGNPSFQGHTANDRAVQNENMARMFTRMGLKKGDRALHASVMSMWAGGLPVIDGLLAFGANVIPIGALVRSKKVAEMAALTRPDVMFCTPSFARHLLKVTREEGMVDMASLGIKTLGVHGEPGGSIPEMIAELSAGYGGAKIFDLAGGTSCLNPSFTSCEEHAGLHFIAPDHAYIELIDPATGQSLPWEDGAEGEFVYTGMGRECGPLLRFRDGDKMRITTTPCKCGRAGPRVHIVGRVDDMLLVKGVNVFPSAIRDVALSMTDVLTGNIRVLKHSESPVIEPPLNVKVECIGRPDQETREKIAEALSQEIKRRLRFTANVILFDEGELELRTGATGKIQLIEKTY